MRAVILLGTVLVLCAPYAVAQQTTSVEIGTHLGMNVVVPDDGDPEVFVGVPGGGSILGLWPVLYVTVLPRTGLMFEPQVFFSWNSISESAIFQPVVQLGYLLQPQAKASLYLAAHGGGLFTEDDNSGLIGGGVGFRVRATDGFALRFEGRYRRWLCENCDWQDISFLVGLGGIAK